MNTKTFMETNWWMLMIRGLVAVFFGMLALFLPGITLLTLIMLFAIYVFADGAINLVTAVQNRDTYQRWWITMLQGGLSMLVGVLTVLWPGLTGLALLYVIALWALITGVFEVIAAYELRKEIDNEWILALSGILSVVFGLMLLLFPFSGVLAVVWIIAIYAILFGVMQISLGFRLRNYSDNQLINQPS